MFPMKTIESRSVSPEEISAAFRLFGMTFRGIASGSIPFRRGSFRWFVQFHVPKIIFGRDLVRMKRKTAWFRGWEPSGWFGVGIVAAWKDRPPATVWIGKWWTDLVPWIRNLWAIFLDRDDPPSLEEIALELDCMGTEG